MRPFAICLLFFVGVLTSLYGASAEKKDENDSQIDYQVAMDTVDSQAQKFAKVICDPQTAYDDLREKLTITDEGEEFLKKAFTYAVLEHARRSIIEDFQNGTFLKSMYDGIRTFYGASPKLNWSYLQSLGMNPLCEDRECSADVFGVSFSIGKLKNHPTTMTNLIGDRERLRDKKRRAVENFLLSQAKKKEEL